MRLKIKAKHEWISMTIVIWNLLLLTCLFLSVLYLVEIFAMQTRERQGSQLSGFVAFPV